MKSIFTHVPWKRNLLKIPLRIRAKLPHLAGKDIVALSTLVLTKEAVEKGTFSHLGITLNGGKIRIERSVLMPDRRMGRHSAQNRDGTTVVRRDKRKIPKHFSFNVPDWGDWAKGSHTVDQTRLVYPRELIPPSSILLKITLLTEDEANNQYVIDVRTDRVLPLVKAEEMEEELLHCLNLLQENCGTCDVALASISRADYLATITVDWQLLPPGRREENLRLLKGTRPRQKDATDEKTIEDRYDFLEQMKPKAFISGTDQFQRYFGAMFDEDLIVLENMDYGNAIYAMGSNWKELSKLSRTSLLKIKESANFNRLPHVYGWKDKLKRHINEHMRNVRLKAIEAKK